MNCRTLNNPYRGVRPAEIIALQFKGKNSQKPGKKRKQKMETSTFLDKTEKRDPERNVSQYLNHLKMKRGKKPFRNQENLWKKMLDITASKIISRILIIIDHSFQTKVFILLILMQKIPVAHLLTKRYPPCSFVAILKAYITWNTPKFMETLDLETRVFSPVAFTGRLVSGGKQQDLKVFPQFIRHSPLVFPLTPP